MLKTACEKTVEKVVKKHAQTLHLITSSTAGLLEISQTTTLVRLLKPARPQLTLYFAQPFFDNLSLLVSDFYSLSPIHNDANEFNKGFII